MLSHLGLTVPAAACSPSGASWQLSKSVESSNSSYSVAAATNCSSMLGRASTVGGKQGCSWQRGGRGQPEHFHRCKVCALPILWWVRSHVPSVLVLPLLCDSAQRHCHSITSPECERRGAVGKGCVTPAQQDGVLSLLLPAASKKGDISIWIRQLLAHAKAACRGPSAGGHAGGTDPSFGFRFLQPFSRSPSKCPSATVQALRSSQSAQHG